MSKKEPLFFWDEETGEASCIIKYKNNVVFYGLATCHPDDRDMISEKTGCEIAYRRACIKALEHHLNNEVVPALKALNQTYYSMNRSKYFNEKSYENHMLQRQIRQLNEDLTTTKEMLASAKQSLISLLKEKELFYKRIRSIRQAKNE